MLNYIRDKGVIDKYEDDEYMDRAIKVVERLIEEQIKLIYEKLTYRYIFKYIKGINKFKVNKNSNIK